MIKLLVILILGLVAVLTIISYSNRSNIIKVHEGFENRECPDVLIQKGKHIYLINNNVARIPSVNPIKFNNLEEYTEYLKWQRHMGIKCPVLYLQNSYDIQGNLVYVNRNSPFDKRGGTPIISGLDLFNNNNRSLLLDSTRNHPPFNQNLYPGFDPQDQNIGLKTPLDKMYHANPGGVSPNAMDSNWGGSTYTESKIRAGDYKQNEVKIYIPNGGDNSDDSKMPRPPGGVDAVYGIPMDSNINLKYKHKNRNGGAEKESKHIRQLRRQTVQSQDEFRRN
jgi:hypothetical protein